MTRKRILVAILLLLLAAAAGLVALVIRHGVSARETPMGIEALVARQMRHLAIPSNARSLKNPVPPDAAALAAARAHFADHCALCHGNDGRGRTEMGRNLYPKAPDMTLAPTQSLSDGELFFIIKNGVRLTGMPAWGNDSPEADHDSWKLVHFIRHLPKITEAELSEMEVMNPVSPLELKEREEAARFLEGKTEPPLASRPHTGRQH
jgi:mono/diheme cytochrome c family protein